MVWKAKRVLVTGAGGFIGSHLCETLVEMGAEVTAMIRYTSRADLGNLEFLSPDRKAVLRIAAGNIEDSHFVESQVQNQDVVFHLAALVAIPYSYVAPLSYVRANVEGTLNVLEACKKSRLSRLVHTSTSETYGTALYTPIDEKHPMQGQSPYSASKIGADKMAESYFLTYGLPVSTLRPFNTFGPRQSARAVIPTIISQALWEKEIRLGALTPIRDFTFVRDTVQGFLKIAESDKTIGKTLNVGSGSGIAIGELAREILSLMNCKKTLVNDAQRMRPESSEVFNLICNSAQLGTSTGWKPQVNLSEGLSETVEFIKMNPALFKPERYSV